MSNTYEPILDPNNRRFTLFPIQYPGLWELFKKQEALFWKAEEIDMSKDYEDFVKCDADTQTFIKHVLAFFAASDGIVNFNLSNRFLNEITVMEANVCYTYQMMMENVHSLMYSMMLDNLIKDPQEKEKMFQAIQTIPAIKRMADWTFKWIESDRAFAFRVVAFIIVEGLFFSGMFASIYWLKAYKGNILAGLIKSNEFIQRDENQHVGFGVEIYKLLHNPLTRSELIEILHDGLEVSKNFMKEALQVKLIGMSGDSMNAYLEYVADRIMVDLGYDKVYLTENPFEFMKNIGLQGKVNFFEARSTEYATSYGHGSTKKKLELLDDF